MRRNTIELRAELIEKTRLNINRVQVLMELTIQDLNHKKNKDIWSVLECIEHLNLYSRYYNPEIKRAIESSYKPKSDFFRGGVLGNYFVKLMMPKKKLNKMKTFKDKNPGGSNLKIDVLVHFVDQQKEFLELIEKSKNVNLTQTKTAISISKLMKLRLGDTFRFNIAHNERHILQAEKILDTI